MSATMERIQLTSENIREAALSVFAKHEEARRSVLEARKAKDIAAYLAKEEPGIRQRIAEIFGDAEIEIRAKWHSGDNISLRVHVCGLELSVERQVFSLVFTCTECERTFYTGYSGGYGGTHSISNQYVKDLASLGQILTAIDAEQEACRKQKEAKAAEPPVPTPTFAEELGSVIERLVNEAVTWRLENR